MLTGGAADDEYRRAFKELTSMAPASAEPDSDEPDWRDDG